MTGTSDVYILVTVQPDALKNAAQQLKEQGFDVRNTAGINSPCDFIIFFNASNEKLGDLRSRIKKIHGINDVCILPAFPV